MPSCSLPPCKTLLWALRRKFLRTIAVIGCADFSHRGESHLSDVQQLNVRRLRYRIAVFAHSPQVSCNRITHTLSRQLKRSSRSDTPRQVGCIRPKPGFRLFEKNCICDIFHLFSPVRFSIDFSVPIGISSDVCPLTVAFPGFEACTN